MQSRFIFFWIIAALNGLPQAQSANVTGAQVDGSLITETLFVAPPEVMVENEAATGETVYRSLQEVADEAMRLARQGTGVRILVMPGSYRESLSFTGGAPAGVPILVEAWEEGKAIVDGADVVDEWTIRKGSFVRKIPAWIDRESPPPPFVEGVRLLPGKSRRTTGMGEYFYDWETSELVISPPRYGKVVDGAVRIPRRRTLLHAQGVEALVVKGLRFTGSAAGPALRFARSENVALQNCRIDYNSGVGLALDRCRAVTMDGSLIERNGDGGANLHAENVYLVDFTVRLNGWRRGEAPVAGAFLGLRRFAVNRCTISENHGTGLLISGESGVLNEIKLLGNTGPGLVLLHAAALRVDGGTFALNGRGSTDRRFPAGGVVVPGRSSSGARQIEISNTIVYGNGGSQIHLASEVSGFSLAKSIIVASDTKQGLLRFDQRQVDYRGMANLFHAPRQDTFAVAGTRLSFPQWQALWRADLNSMFADPRLRDPENYQFLPRRNSPFFERDSWPIREISDAAHEAVLQKLSGSPN